MEYQYERLHIYGDEHPETGLKNKVKRWQFAQTIEVIDPITHELDKKPMKPFMVNQLTIAFERSNIIMSPWDNTLYKQLVDYEVVGQNKNTKLPIYTDKNEHYIDALGLAFLAMVLEFKDLTKQIKSTNVKNIINLSNKSVLSGGANHVFAQITESYKSTNIINRRNDSDDLPGDRPTWIRVPNGKRSMKRRSWGIRSSNSFSRSMW